MSPETSPHVPYVAFRYAHPLTEVVYQNLLDDGFGKKGRAIAFSQYPQYSCGTTGSSLNEIARCQSRLESESKSSRIQWSVIDRWPSHPKFIEAVVRNIQAALATYPVESRDKVTILFSAHSQPMTAVDCGMSKLCLPPRQWLRLDQGDAYSTEVSATVFAVMQRLDFCNKYRVTWQSKVGYQPWLGPQTSSVVETYIKKYAKPCLLLVPIAFTSDHIETLYELDEELIGESGHRDTIRRVESLNGSELFVKALAGIAMEHIRNGYKASRQFENRCLDCKKEVCGEVRKIVLK